MSALSAAASDEDGDTIKALRARVASLEALLRGEPGFYITMPRAVVEQALECLEGNISYDFHGNPYEESDELMQTAAANLRAALEQPQAEQEPVTAQHRFRHPQKTMPDWSVWQPCKVAKRPAWEIDSQGYEVEYMPLYTQPQPPRQPLTDEQIREIGGLYEEKYFDDGWSVDFARMIEAAHGIGESNA